MRSRTRCSRDSIGSRHCWRPPAIPAVKDRLLKGWTPTAGEGSFRNHLDGFNQLPYLTGQQPKGARNEFYYFNDDGDLVAHAFRRLEVCVRGTAAARAA